MKRSYRIGISLGAALASIGIVTALVRLGTATEGPMMAALDAIGGAVNRLEGRAVAAVRGPGRAHSLAWLAPIRANADSLRHPSRLLLGAFHDQLPTTLEGVLELERTLDAPLAIVQIYTAWGDRPDQRFPTRVAHAIIELGSIPLITWEPWLTDFENRLHPQLPLRHERDRGGLAAIAAGTYDFYIDAWAREAARLDRPFFLRLAHEMNDPYRYPWGPQNNQSWEFIQAWRHVVERFRSLGADNVVWVWSPHLAYEGWEDFYPGDDVVDWIATGALNYGTVANWSRWWSFDEIFTRHYHALAALGKPIMSAELGTLAVGGDRVAWYRDALDNLEDRLPAVRALLFFHTHDDRTLTYQALDWSFVGDPASLAAIRDALAGSRAPPH